MTNDRLFPAKIDAKKNVQVKMKLRKIKQNLPTFSHWIIQKDI